MSWLPQVQIEVIKMARAAMPKHLATGSRRWAWADFFYSPKDQLFFVEFRKVTKKPKGHPRVEKVVLSARAVMEVLRVRSPRLYEKQIFEILKGEEDESNQS